jgi:DNA modification methylase
VTHKEVIGDATLYLGDCMEVLPTLPKVDAVITDPPYGVLDESWDDMSRRELARFTMAWASRASMLSDTAVIFFGERTRSVVAPILSALYEDVRQIIWNKMGGSVAEDRMFYAFESAYFCHPADTWETAEPKSLLVGSLLAAARSGTGLSRGSVDMAIRGKKTGLCFRWEEGACLPTPEQVAALKKFLPLGSEFDAAITDAWGDKELSVERARAETAKRAAKALDVVTCPPPAQREHPTQKPVALMSQMLDVAVPNGGAVLDCFAGSGSTGVAAVAGGLTFIGIEREPKYFDIACRRIEQAYKQRPLFDAEPPRKPEQLGIDA